MYNVNQINKAIKTYVENEMIPALPTIMKIAVATYVDSMQLDQELMNQLVNSTIIKPLNIGHDGLYDLDTALDNFENNAKKYGPMEFVVKNIGPIPLKEQKVFTFKAEDISKLKTYLKQQQ